MKNNKSKVSKCCCKYNKTGVIMLFSVLLLGMALFVASDISAPAVLGVKAKSENSGKSNKSEVNSDESNKIKESKDKGSSGSSTNVSKSIEHKKIITEVVKNLDEVAREEELQGNSETSELVSDVAENTEEIVDETTDAIEAIETRPAWKVALLGPDYKNLGQLRSSISHNTNEIRKLNKTLVTTTPENREVVEEQLETLNAERERIRNMINQNESKFSLFGWLFRFMEGYTQTPIDDEVGGIVEDTDTLDDDTTDELENNPDSSEQEIDTEDTGDTEQQP